MFFILNILARAIQKMNITDWVIKQKQNYIPWCIFDTLNTFFYVGRPQGCSFFLFFLCFTHGTFIQGIYILNKAFLYLFPPFPLKSTQANWSPAPFREREREYGMMSSSFIFLISDVDKPTTWLETAIGECWIWCRVKCRTTSACISYFAHVGSIPQSILSPLEYKLFPGLRLKNELN